MLLLINTCDDNKIIIGLSDGQKVLNKKSVQSNFCHIEKILPLINLFLTKNKIKLSDLTGIIVAKGSGGFSSVRIGVATANALSLVLGIPAVGVRINSAAANSLGFLLNTGVRYLRNDKRTKVVIPEYDREPNIAAPKD